MLCVRVSARCAGFDLARICVELGDPYYQLAVGVILRNQSPRLGRVLQRRAANLAAMLLESIALTTYSHDSVKSAIEMLLSSAVTRNSDFVRIGNHTSIQADLQFDDGDAGRHTSTLSTRTLLPSVRVRDCLAAAEYDCTRLHVESVDAWIGYPIDY